MTRVSSREEAEQLVADIAIGYGHVPEKYQQELQKVSPGAREAFNRVISESREAIDGPIIA